MKTRNQGMDDEGVRGRGGGGGGGMEGGGIRPKRKPREPRERESR